MTVTAWHVETNSLILRRMGKTNEELAELSKVCSRITIQGYAGIDPETGIPNKESLIKEIADVYAQLHCTVDALGLDVDVINKRIKYKMGRMAAWEALVNGEHKD